MLLKVGRADTVVQMTAEKVGNGNRWNCQDTIKSDSETHSHTGQKTKLC